jgi:hypothetical protein
VLRRHPKTLYSTQGKLKSMTSASTDVVLSGGLVERYVWAGRLSPAPDRARVHTTRWRDVESTCLIWLRLLRTRPSPSVGAMARSKTRTPRTVRTTLSPVP